MTWRMTWQFINYLWRATTARAKHNYHPPDRPLCKLCGLNMRLLPWAAESLA